MLTCKCHTFSEVLVLCKTLSSVSLSSSPKQNKKIGVFKTGQVTKQHSSVAIADVIWCVFLELVHSGFHKCPCPFIETRFLCKEALIIFPDASFICQCCREYLLPTFYPRPNIYVMRKMASQRCQKPI